MDGLEYSEILFSQIDLGDRFDSDYYTKNYLHISDQMSKVSTEKLGKLATAVASAFYPAATQLYSEGDTAFARCVDCVSYPVITKDQDSKFEKIPYTFGKKNKGISFIKTEDIIITKVGTPCYASILTDYDEIALSRTVMGLTGIHGIDPYYLMVFLRCKYGFEQLFRQRELTIQYQLTLPRVKAVDVFLADDKLQKAVNRLCGKSREFQKNSNEAYQFAEQTLLEIVKCPDFSAFGTHSIKSINESFTLSGRLDAEYYQPKYDEYASIIGHFNGGSSLIRTEFSQVKKICDRKLSSYKYVEIGDVNVSYGFATANEVATPDLPDNAKIMAKKDDIIISTVRPNRGAVAVLEDDNLLVSGAFTVLREKGTYKKEVLQVLLRLPFYRDWLLRYNVGTSYPVIKDSDVLNMPIPLFDKETQNGIVQKVKESSDLRNQSKRLLEYAKQAVEIAIEQGEGVALKWLKDKLPVEV